tara:strand:- start:18007 stop:18291 length:285 start_codon:yes stop_codon:yes gene_type:complete
MFEELLKITGTIALPIMLSAIWLRTPVVEEEEVNPFKKAPEGCNPPQPWDPNFKEYETIEERQRVSQIKEALEIVLRGLEKIEYQESQELDKED